MKLWNVWLMAFALLCLLPLVASAKNDAPVSPALSVLSKGSCMAVSSVSDDEIVLAPSDFEKFLNVSYVSSITVEELPERSDGILYLGGSEVSVGQVISRAEIPYMRFVFMNEDVANSSMIFSTNHGPYSMTCSFYRLAYENRCPVISYTEDGTLAVSTYRDISVYGKMDAYDPDGDELTYEVVSYPQNGLLFLTDSQGGYKYVPSSRFLGEDHFSYVAVDRYGNYSEVTEVVLSVSSAPFSQVYSDLLESEIHVAAISLTDKGVMSSTELGGTYYFYPNAEVTRAEFVAMAMKTMNIHVSGENSRTVFTDDGEIPEAYRGYVNLAQKLGYVCGKLDENGNLFFDPNTGITRAEAVTILYNMVDLEIPVIKPLFADMDTVPVWARDAVYAAAHCGLMTRNGGYIEATGTLTRADAALMLYELSSFEIQ